MDSSELLALEASPHLLHFTNWILRIETSVNHIRGSDCRRHKSTSSYIILFWVAGLSFNRKASDEHMGIVKRLINFKQNELSLYVHTHTHMESSFARQYPGFQSLGSAGGHSICNALQDDSPTKLSFQQSPSWLVTMWVFDLSSPVPGTMCVYRLSALTGPRAPYRHHSLLAVYVSSLERRDSLSTAGLDFN